MFVKLCMVAGTHRRVKVLNRFRCTTSAIINIVSPFFVFFCCCLRLIVAIDLQQHRNHPVEADYSKKREFSPIVLYLLC